MQLEISKANTIIATIPLQPGTYTLGRGKDNDICLTDSSVSRSHARLEISDDFQVRVVDLNSSNGTRLNSTRITSKIWPPVGTVLNIGECQLVLRTSDDITSASHSTLLPVPQTTISTEVPQNQSLQHKPQQQILHQPEHQQLSQAQPQKVEHQIPHKGSTSRRKIWEKAKVLGIVLIISPFIAFAGKNIIQADSTTLEKVESKQRIKNQSLWLKKTHKAITVELANVRDFITNDAYDPALNLLKEILLNNPGNKQALGLQIKIREKLAEFEEKKQQKEQETARHQREQKRMLKKRKGEQLKKQIERYVMKKDFSNCIQTAQKLLAIDPADDIAATAITFCSQSLASSKNNGADVIEHEKKKLLSKLKSILQKGEAAVRKKKYNNALHIWEKARKIDPEKIFNTTKKIHRKAAKLRKNIAKWVKDNISKGKNAAKNNDHIAALKYYRTAQLIKPSDKEIKQLYDTQMKKNHILAEEMYNEAIAYASLDSLDNAKKAINTAKLLAAGNDKLLKLINKNIADLKLR